MPSHQDNLKTVIDACVRANPEIVKNPHAQHLKFDGTTESIVEMRPINAADVLLALGEDYAVRGDGSLWELDEYEDTFLCDIELRETLYWWDETTVAALAALLKRDD